MPLSRKAQMLLEEFSKESGEYTLVGLLANPITGEMGTFCSHQMLPGHVLSFLNRGVGLMMSAAADGTLQGVGDGTGEAGAGTPAQGPKGDEYVH